jgi:hypothetical protein
MGSDQSAAADAAYNQNLMLSSELYGMAKPALSSAMGYLGSAFQSGQMLDTSGKAAAERANFGAQTAGQSGSFLDPVGMGNAGSARAAGMSGIGAEQIGGAVDQMNQIRSLLAGQGLKTTNAAAQAGGLETQALGYMNSGNATASTIKGIAGGAAGLYGAGTQAGWWGQAATPGGSSGSSGWVNPASGQGGIA